MYAKRFVNFLADPDVAIDLGTANTRVFVLNRGVVAEQPTRVLSGGAASHTNEVPDRKMTGPAQELSVPLCGGVVHDIDAAAQLLGGLLRRARRLGWIKPRAIVCAPSDANSAERANLIETVRRSGISQIKILPEPLASAVGAGLDISSSYGQMLVDIGDGVTDLAVIRSRRIIATRTTRHAAGDLRAALQALVRHRKNLNLRQREAERLVQQNGVIDQAKPERPLSAMALDPGGAAVPIELQPREVVEAVDPVLAKIVELIRATLKDLPAELAVEVLESGICLSGGGACLRGIDHLIARETCAEVRIAADPLRSTIIGAGEILAGLSQTGSWETDW